MEFLSTTIHGAAFAAGYHEQAPEYGERAWRVTGRDVDVVYWDVGNSWSGLITVIAHDGSEHRIVEFWRRLYEFSEDAQ